MVTLRFTARTAVAVAMALLFTAGMTFAADSTPKIGVLNVQKILTDAPRIKQYMEQYEVLKQQLAQKLDIRSQNLMLDENQVKELIDLKQKATQSDSDKARITEIEKAERDLDSEFKTLQTTAQPTEEQKARLKVLQDLRDKSTSTGNALERDYNSQLATRFQELDQKTTADMQEAVNKVAEAKGLTFVFVKDAVLIGGIDITDDVMGKLDRKAQ